ncbi:MAG: tyrosine-type recombinase/integrase, partial [Caulobacteraceae bacterium]
ATFKAMVRRLGDRLGDKHISEIKRSSCKAYVEQRTKDKDPRYKDQSTAPCVSSETARRELEILSAAIGHWDGEHKLTTRPTVWLPDKPESQRDALTRAQAAALVKAALGYRKASDGSWERLGGSAKANRAHLRRFLLIGLYTGSRHDVIRTLLWNEAPSAPWADLDKGMVYRRGKQERDHSTKRRPVVKMPRRLLTHMRRWKRLDDARGINANTVLHHGGAPIAGPIRTGFAGIVRDAGLPEGITPHWLRHTCATWLMERGVDMWEAASFTGMTVAVLEKHYAHHRPDFQEAARTGAGGKRAS